jgi:hypothetical protein
LGHFTEQERKRIMNYTFVSFLTLHVTEVKGTGKIELLQDVNPEFKTMIPQKDQKRVIFWKK